MDEIHAVVLAANIEKAEKYVRGKYSIKYLKSSKVRHGQYLVAATFMDAEYDS